MSVTSFADRTDAEGPRLTQQLQLLIEHRSHDVLAALESHSLGKDADMHHRETYHPWAMRPHARDCVDHVGPCVAIVVAL